MQIVSRFKRNPITGDYDVGCDIHPIIERKIAINGVEKWVTVSTLEYRNIFAYDRETDSLKRISHCHAPAVQNRNYKRFGLFANVRDGGQNAKGLPEDVAEYTKFLSDEYGSDGHNHSWLTLRETLEHCLASEHDAVNVFFKDGDPRKETPLMYYFGLDIETYDDRDSIDNYRLVFWFDN